MKSRVGLNFLALVTMAIASFEAVAYYDEKEEAHCREPKIQEFNLPEFHGEQAKETPAEAEFSFVVSGWADPKKIKVMGKDKPIPFTVESNETFHKIKGKIPAEYTGKYVRLNVRVPAVLGCYANQGWLLKIAGASTSAPAAAEQPPAPADASVKPEQAPAPESSPAQGDSAPALAAPAAKPETKSAEPAQPAQ